MTVTIGSDEFDETYRPLPNPLDSSASFDGALLETYGPELDHVTSADPHHVWTVLDGAPPVIVSGFHVVNRLGYLITEVGHGGADIDVEI
jgi:hypothetical protein